MQSKPLDIDVYTQLYRLDPFNVMILQGLVGCAVYSHHHHDFELGQITKLVLTEGWIGSEATLNRSHRLIQRAFSGRLKGADDACARLISSAVDGYQRRSCDEGDEDLPIMWGIQWLEQIGMAAHKNRVEMNQNMLALIYEFESAIFADVPLARETQRAILSHMPAK
ncbi:hypothetical protein [Deinococcus puniceus]|uniref:Uncharacterized protein n=1 Tax=Deinococcus puniceus TaxID=1182568 RepID=A0A172T7R2_9DEIO|nr:hypothetical protein [Deinococcus puniceus]ANE43031.1 hypothetical protein SU48_03765 [Deinococcus puniceus]